MSREFEDSEDAENAKSDEGTAQVIVLLRQCKAAMAGVGVGRGRGGGGGGLRHGVKE